MKKHFTTVLLVLVFLAGLSLLLYPTVSNWWNTFHASRAVASYTDAVTNLNEEEYKKVLDAAVKYNELLVDDPTRFLDTGKMTTDGYFDTLNITGDGMMGYIDIPSINVTIPIYHGTSDSVLAIAVGHLYGTSLPVGGPGTHSVLSGHRGLPSAKLFTDLDKVVEGDRFTIHILDEVLTYQVDRIRIVLPQKVNDIAIEKDKDYCTLVTCTPYGVNTHRILVRGVRVENDDNTVVRVPSDAIRIDPMVVAPVVAAPIMLILMLFVLFVTPKKKGKTKKKNNVRKNS